MGETDLIKTPDVSLNDYDLDGFINKSSKLLEKKKISLKINVKKSTLLLCWLYNHIFYLLFIHIDISHVGKKNEKNKLVLII